MGMNPVQARMFSIRTLQNSMFEYLYSEQENKAKEQLADIAIKNQQLLQCDSASFGYAGKFYGSMLCNKQDGTINKELHPSLLRQVCNIINKPNFDAVTVRTHINHMFGIILIKAQHVIDLQKLLPSAFLTQIREVDPVMFNIGDPLSDQAIQIIKDKTAKSTAYINELCLTRLLLTN